MGWATHGVASRHVGRGVLAGRGGGRTVSNRVEGDPSVHFFQEFFVERMVDMVEHIFVCLEMIEHLKSLIQGLARGNHAKAFLFQFACVVDRERVAFDGARMGREKHLIKLPILFTLHFIDHLRLIRSPQTFVLVDFLFE